MFLYAAPKSFKTGKQLLSRRAERRADGQTQSRPTHCCCRNDWDEQIGAEGKRQTEGGATVFLLGVEGNLGEGAEPRRLKFHFLWCQRWTDGWGDRRTIKGSNLWSAQSEVHWTFLILTNEESKLVRQKVVM